MEEPMTDVFLDMDMAQEDVIWYETAVVEHKMDDSVHTPHSHSPSLRKSLMLKASSLRR